MPNIHSPSELSVLSLLRVDWQALPGSKAARFINHAKNIKAGKLETLEVLHERIGTKFRSQLTEYLPTKPVFIPVPRSRILKPEAWWPGLWLAESLRDAFGGSVSPALTRMKTIPPSSSRRKVNERTSYDIHVQTLGFQSMIFDSVNIVLVDDVTTTGTTLLAAADVVMKHLPTAKILGVAAVRGEKLSPDDTEMVLPKREPSSGMVTGS